MKRYIDVADEAEGDLIAEGLLDPEVRALVKVVAVLKPLTKREQADVLNRVNDKLEIL